MQPSWIGQTLSGRYVLEALLGQGGMSAVYRGSDPNLKRPVAVKLIHAHLSSNAEFVRRFEREAEAVARLRHPNIIQVYDFAHDGEVYYMVLEYLPGVTLQQRLEELAAQGRRLPLAEAVRIMARVCEAVAYAHDQNMVHRDLKPANVMLNPQGEPILMDFGVARMLGAAGHTATGTLIGTAYYMSPEQVQGKHPDGRADIYSLGVMLFEILSGRRPFDAESATAVMMKHLTEPVPDLRALNPEVPGDLVAVVNRALAKDPKDRFQSGLEMAQALRAASLRPDPQPAGTILESPEPAPAGTVLEAPPPPPPAQTSAARPASPPPAQTSAARSGPPPAAAPGLSSLAPPPAAAQQKSRLPVLAAAGVGGLLLLVCLAVGAFALYNAASGGGLAGGPTATFEPTADAGAAAALAAALTQTAAAPTATSPLPTNTPALIPTFSPTEETGPTETPPPTEPAGPFVRITNVRIEGNRYLVDYETFGYQEVLPGMHVHFFFDTVPPEQAGVPAPPQWFVWGGPRPFDGYTVANRPAAATQMCALVANPNHSVIPASGTCYDLP